MYGGYGDCTAFATKGANYDTYGHMLTKMGYHNSGNQLLYNGFTGEQIYSEIFIGPTYYMRLKHMVKDKINYRATGKRNFLTRQTNQGRANDGGLKIGEMERDGILAHGMSYFLNESYMVRGDQYFMGICNKTGAIAIYNPDTNLFLSPLADGPLVFNKNVEGQEVLNAISRFGRSFSIVRIPFALKLLIQELQVMNIQMRVITEDNIDQLMNLSYQSRNIDKLLHIDQTVSQKEVKEIIDNYKIEKDKLFAAEVNKRNRASMYLEDEQISPRSLEYTPEQQTQVSAPDSSQITPDARVIEQVLINQEPDKDWEASPPFAPPFDEPEKNDIYEKLPRYVQDNIMRLNVDGDDARWYVVNEAYKQTTGFLPQTPIQKGGAIIFNDPLLDDTFNNLSGAQQAKILELDTSERDNVMNAILKRTMQGNELNSSQINNDPLNEAFKALPLDKQLVALQGGYNSMAKEFNKLGSAVPEITTTISRPEPVSVKLAKEFPLLAIEGGDNS
ncbi:hypothetical protein EBU24_06355, partial [bacterium]|nr:hypothetical protein [bacterium]